MAKKKSKDWRRSPQWAKARRLCLKRHDHTCFITGQKLKTLDVHHIKDASTNPKLRYKQDNLVPIKPEYHKFYHIFFLGGFQKPTNYFTLILFKWLIQFYLFLLRVRNSMIILFYIVAVYVAWVLLQMEMKESFFSDWIKQNYF